MNQTEFPEEIAEIATSLAIEMGHPVNRAKIVAAVLEAFEENYEKFLEAGFDVETAVRMMNSAMVMKGQEDLFSTVDISELDLYDGTCHFYKIGAAATFIRRNGIVECLISTSLPVGVSYKLDMEKSEKDLYNGDFLVMVSDGILDAFPGNHGEDKVQELILNETTDNAAEMAKNILEEVLKFRRRKAEDDMTVLVGGLWRR